MRRHWYTIKISYLKDNRVLFAVTTDVALACQSDILKTRALKKAVCGKLIMQLPQAKQLLCNGSLGLAVVAYLGKFRGNAPSLREYVCKAFGDWLNGHFIHWTESVR